MKLRLSAVCKFIELECIRGARLASVLARCISLVEISTFSIAAAAAGGPSNNRTAEYNRWIDSERRNRLGREGRCIYAANWTHQSRRTARRPDDTSRSRLSVCAFTLTQLHNVVVVVVFLAAVASHRSLASNRFPPLLSSRSRFH